MEYSVPDPLEVKEFNKIRFANEFPGEPGGEKIQNAIGDI